ncbi:rhomboid family intramembrane serine protease [Thioclava sp. GXIMD4216]|uniref:Rhomboid family intramembrane serine protease n=1 Tax=Thioclava litoralis TaxID=3076557 RepID=A0ABZ1DWC2_9RHOB|nr:rhomboid family intramembrane serine protease [Thioclava sp. FTW29]
MRSGYTEGPLNKLPPIVWLLAAPIIIGELMFGLGQAGLFQNGIVWRPEALQRFAYDPNLMRAMMEAGVHPWKQMARVVTYPFVHGSFTHAAFVLVFILALGKMVGEVFRGWAVAVVFFASSILAALIYTALPFTQSALYGGYPAAYGLIGAFSFIQWTYLGHTRGNRMQAFQLIGFLMGIQLLFSVIFGGTDQWIADLAGFIVGFLVSFLVSPGGWGRVLAKLRNRR